MQGDVADGAIEKQGMIPRAIQVVFDSIAGLACERHVSLESLIRIANPC
jgi:hypothetical protein